MPNMLDEMRKKAIPISSATRSPEIAKAIPRCDVVELNRTLEPAIQQNRRERIASEEAASGMIFGGRI